MNLYDAITKMNKLHKESKMIIPVLVITWSVGMLGLLGSALIAPESMAPFFFILFIVAGMAFLIVWVLPKAKAAEQELKTLYKDTFLNGMFNEFFDNARYMGTFGFTQHKVKEFDLYELGNEFQSEDQLTGDYQGVHFEQSDVHIWEYRRRSENDKFIHYFNGRMFVFDLPVKNIESVKIFNKLPMDLKQDYRIRGSEKNRVEMESVEFNQKYSVYSENAHDAFYILTPPMMERLMQMFQQYCYVTDYMCKNISFHFNGDKLYFTMECDSNAFDAGKFPISYPDEKKKLKADIQVIIDLIEALDLIDKNAINEKETEETVRDFWAPSWTQEEGNVDVTDGEICDVSEETPKPYSGGLKLKM